MKAGADRMVNRQLFAIDCEAVCGFLVFGGDDAQQVYRRRHRDRQLELLPSDALDGLTPHGGVDRQPAARSALGDF